MSILCSALVHFWLLAMFCSETLNLKKLFLQVGGPFPGWSYNESPTIWDRCQGPHFGNSQIDRRPHACRQFGLKEPACCRRMALFNSSFLARKGLGIYHRSANSLHVAWHGALNPLPMLPYPSVCLNIYLIINTPGNILDKHDVRPTQRPRNPIQTARPALA